MTPPKCPNCQTPIRWNRFLINRSIWSRWPCIGCGHTLKFTWQRGLLFGITLPLLIAILTPMSLMIVQLTGLPIFLVVLLTYLPLALLALLLIDKVELA